MSNTLCYLYLANLQNSGWWIGARRMQGEFKWQSVTGGWGTMSYTNWYNGQPDNYQGKEDCVQIVKNESPPFGWNDNECGVKLPFLCEATENYRGF